MATPQLALLAPRRLFATLTWICIGGLVIVALLGRTANGDWRQPALPAALALAVATLALAGLSKWWRDDVATKSHSRQVAVLVTLSTLTAPVAWFFGPSSGFASVLVLLLVLVGLLGGGSPDVPRSRLGSWLVYVAIASSQVVLVVLQLGGTLPDASLLPVKPPGHALWEHVSALVMLQVVYLAAFLAGRRFRERYARIVVELNASLNSAARRDALLEEARVECQRALVVGKQGIFTGQALGSFQIGELIGRGGHGEVYEAKDQRDGTNVAVKVLRGDRLALTGEVQRFLAEGAAAQKVQSPHVARVIHAAGLEAAIPFIAMERLVGIDLHSQVDQHGPLGRSELRDLIAHTTAALEAVHATDQVHGDVHPFNLISTAQGWKLIDFGAAGANGGHGGLRGIAAPEKLLPNTKLTPRSDVYELSATLYYAFTGRYPFSDAGSASLARAVAADAPLDPRMLAPIPDDVASVLRIGLAKEPAKRFTTIAELRQALERAFDGALEPQLRNSASKLAPWSVASRQVPVEPTQSLERAPSDSATVQEPFAPTEPLPARVMIEAAKPTAAPATPHKTQTGSLDDHRAAAWQQAFFDRVRRQRIGVLAFCASGGLLLSLIVSDPRAMLFCLACIGGIALVLMLLDARSSWTWSLTGILTVGPAVALGTHSGFAAIVAFFLFVGGMFRTRDSDAWWDSPLANVTALVAAHTLAFALIAAGVIPDVGNMPTTTIANAPIFAGLLLHAGQMGIYVAANLAARRVHVRYDELVRRSEVAVRAAIQQDAMLATARAELQRAAAGETRGVLTDAQLGSYRVGRLLGRGGMGEVYEALAGEQRFALKVIRGDRLSNPNSLRRFRREAATLRHVESPYVARVIDISSDDILPFIVMELVEGAALADVLHDEAFKLSAIRLMIRDVCRGLDDVHRAGVVHRDVKPSNIIRARRGDATRWTLIDFGIARFLDSSTVTTDNTILGTPAYMAPEQLASNASDARSDLFSFSAVAYRALTGRTAWTTAQALALVRPQPTDPRRAGVSPDLAAVLRIGLAPEPTLRCASASELASMFEAAFDARLDDATKLRARTILEEHPWS